MNSTVHFEPRLVDLSQQHCAPCEGGVAPLQKQEIENRLQIVKGWQVLEPQPGGRPWPQIVRQFQFENFHQTMAFVNAVAWIAHVENHHPDLEVGYQTCQVRYSTHAIQGLSENDFICAAKVNALLPPE